MRKGLVYYVFWYREYSSLLEAIGHTGAAYPAMGNEQGIFSSPWENIITIRQTVLTPWIYLRTAMYQDLFARQKYLHISHDRKPTHSTLGIEKNGGNVQEKEQAPYRYKKRKTSYTEWGA